VIPTLAIGVAEGALAAIAAIGGAAAWFFQWRMKAGKTREDVKRDDVNENREEIDDAIDRDIDGRP
jgi:hypothetical protein